MLPRPSTTISFALCSARVTIDPSGSWRRSLSPVTSSLPSGSQSMEYPISLWPLAEATSRLPSRPTATTCRSIQLQNHSRPSCQRDPGRHLDRCGRRRYSLRVPEAELRACPSRGRRFACWCMRARAGDLDWFSTAFPRTPAERSSWWCEVTGSRLDLTRRQILAFRRHAGALDERLSPGRRSLRHAAWAGLQDSMPRAALLSIHARVEGTTPSTWEDSSLVHLWGPRYHTYLVAARDVAVFTLGRLPDEAGALRVAEDLAARLHRHLAGARTRYGDAGSALGMNPNRLRYAAATGTVLIRWDGARQPVVWTVPRPEVDPRDARLELARRYLHIFGPTTAQAFAQWAGIGPRQGVAAFDGLRGSLTPVRTPVGDSWILTSDEPTFRAAPRPAASARLLP